MKRYPTTQFRFVTCSCCGAMIKQYDSQKWIGAYYDKPNDAIVCGDCLTEYVKESDTVPVMERVEEFHDLINYETEEYDQED